MFNYYDPVKNWRRIKPHIYDPKVRQQLHDDFSKYIEGRYGRFGVKYDPEKREWPLDYESVDWWMDRGRGRPPAFHKFVKHGACHWLVNTGLMLAQRAVPQRTWRIVTSDFHSTVWDGEDTLFDFNYTALGMEPDFAWLMARTRGYVLEPGEFLETEIAVDSGAIAD
jgi:hypothetical protein